MNAIELALENIEEGNEVYIVQCDKSLEVCQHNHYGNCAMCSHCKRAMLKNLKEYGLLDHAKVKTLSDIINKDDKREAEAIKTDFHSVKELKDITYKGAQFGYGAFSSYVTYSRNVMPEMTDELRSYIGYYIRKEVMVYSAIERLHQKEHFDLIVFHNGRFAQFKPFLEFAKLHGIDYIATEQRLSKGIFLKDYFYNNIPHDIGYIANNVLKNWDKGDPKTREEIGRSFFEKRKKGVYAGDKIYTKDQHAGEMPENWDDTIENIAIFNSSEDEFLAVSKDYDSYLMFPNQYVALKTLFDHYKGDKTKHFWLRIHPNLKDVPYKSHLALYELKYDNVTIIPASSSISSYAILDNSDKVIIFDSTMGVEAAYWGKPVIALTKYFYYKLGFLYHPENVDEVYKLIDTKDLPVNRNENLIKYGYWILQQNYPEISRVHYDHTKIGRHENYLIMKLFGSHRLHWLFELLVNRYPFFSVFKRIPCTEPYNPAEKS